MAPSDYPITHRPTKFGPLTPEVECSASCETSAARNGHSSPFAQPQTRRTSAAPVFRDDPRRSGSYEPDRQLALVVGRRNMLVAFAGIVEEYLQRVVQLSCLALGQAETDVFKFAAVGGVVDLH